MRIYVSHSREFDYENELYAPLRNLEEHEVFFPHDNNSPGIRTKNIIEQSGLVLAEVSYPSIGQGIELGWADAAGVKITCIHKPGVKISKSLEFITDDIQEYVTLRTYGSFILVD